MSPVYPADIQSLLDQLGASGLAAAALARELAPEQLRWRPNEESWSIAQCVDHLAVAGHAYLAPLRQGVEEARRRGWARREPVEPSWIERKFIYTLEPPPRLRLPAPRKIVPGLAAEPAAVWRDFAAVQTEAATLLKESADLDLNRARFVNPFLPLVRMRVGSGFLVITAHERRHLWQAQKIRLRPEFPRV
jgi:DinB superfamily